MKINSSNLALASAITTAAVWVICSFMVWTMPGSMMNTTGNMVHMDLSKSGFVLTPFGFIWGLVVWCISAGIFAWLLATVYNLLTKD